MRFFMISLFVAAVTAVAAPNAEPGLNNLEARYTCTGGSVFCCNSITADKKCGNGTWSLSSPDIGRALTKSLQDTNSMVEPALAIPSRVAASPMDAPRYKGSSAPDSEAVLLDRWTLDSIIVLLT